MSESSASDKLKKALEKSKELKDKAVHSYKYGYDQEYRLNFKLDTLKTDLDKLYIDTFTNALKTYHEQLQRIGMPHTSGYEVREFSKKKYSNEKPLIMYYLSPDIKIPEYISFMLSDCFWTITGTLEQIEKITELIDNFRPLETIYEFCQQNKLKNVFTKEPLYLFYEKYSNRPGGALPRESSIIEPDQVAAKIVNEALTSEFNLFYKYHDKYNLKDIFTKGTPFTTFNWTKENVSDFDRRRLTKNSLEWDSCPLVWQSSTDKYYITNKKREEADKYYANLTLPPYSFDEMITGETYWAHIPNNTQTFKIIPSESINEKTLDEFYLALHQSIKNPFLFSLATENNAIHFYISFFKNDRTLIETTLRRAFPDFGIEDFENYNNLTSEYSRIRTDFLLYENQYQTIKTIRDFNSDPYQNILYTFQNLLDQNISCRYEIFCRPLSNEYARNVLNNTHSRNTVDFIQGKNPAWFILIRTKVCGDNDEILIQALSKLNQSIKNYGILDNKLLDNRSEKFCSLASQQELLSLAHFPIQKLESESLIVSNMKSKLPPESYTTGNRIGISKARGKEQAVCLPDNIRSRHVYIVGKSGTGKSSLMETIARQDIENGQGIAVIDPHGDVIQHLLEYVPKERVEDVIYFNPRESPISLDILNAENDHEIDLLSDDLITMFRRTSESWGDKMQAILQMAFQTLLRVPGTSFTDISRLLSDDGYRTRILKKIDNQQLLNYWQTRYNQREAEPILIRMDRLTTSSALRHILTQTPQSLNFYDVISEGKIFLADLGKGFLGEATSHLIGSIIVSQIQLSAQRQMQLPEEQRIPFSLFVDEVQNFTTDAFGTILSEARKQKLRLCIAHQFVSQLPFDMQKAVFGNVGTLTFFSLSPDDLGAARHELGDFEIKDVANLPRFNALCRPATSAKDTFSFQTDPPKERPQTNFAKLIIENTQSEYGSLEKPNYEAPPVTEKPTPKPSEFEGKTEAQKTNEKNYPLLIPKASEPIEFNTNTEKILHFVQMCEYLSQPQIIALTGLQASNASTALKKLVATGQIKNLDKRRPKIYFIGKSCKPTTHNLLIRDLFVKIYNSNFAISNVDFNKILPGISPDLTIEFISENNEVFTSYFELDRGTEGVQELVSKADRYKQIIENKPVGFIFEREQDLELARTTIDYDFIKYSVLDRFSTLRENAFTGRSEGRNGNGQAVPYFI